MTQHPDIIPFPGRPAVAAVVPTAARPPGIVVVSSDPQAAQRLAAEIQSLGEEVEVTTSIAGALQSSHDAPDVYVVGPLGEGEQVETLLDQVERRGLGSQVIALRGRGPRALPSAGSLLTLPEDATSDVVELAVASAQHRAGLQRDNRRLRRQLMNRLARDLAGHSGGMQTLRQSILFAADSELPVLICGADGTPTETVAHAVHDSSPRSQRPFTRVDCRLLSAESLEAALWGEHLKNWSPSPAADGPGRLDQAAGGTLFFDGIEAVALPVQRRIASLLTQKRMEHPLTGQMHRFDVRVIASTSVDLKSLADKGLFRPELLAALTEQKLTVPSLADRREDLAALIEHMLRRIAIAEGRPVRALTVDALRAIQTYEWPGNDAELESVLQHVCGMDAGNRITASSVQPWLGRAEDEQQVLPIGGILSLRDMERRLIETTFARFEGNREKTAKALQIGIRTLCGKLREYGYPPRGGPGSNRQSAPAAHVMPETRAA